MTDIDLHTKRCMYCGRPVSVSAYRCPHCNRSLAAVEQEQWEQSDPSTESSEESYDRQEPGSGIRISPAAVVVCLVLIAGAIIYGLFFRTPEKSKELPAVFSRPVREPAASAVEKTASEKTPFIRIHDDADSTVKDISASAKAPGASEIEDEERIRQEKIQLVSAEILETLRRENAEIPHTVRLTSGREIECEVIDQSDTQVTIMLGGLTATLDRKAVESIERQSTQAAEEEMQKTSLARATQIVDQGLVRHGDEWIAPEEKARREQRGQARKEEETEAGEIPEKEKTDKQRLESLLALARQKGSADADFFGGTLHIQDRSSRWPSGKDDLSSIVALAAQAEQIDIAQLCDFLKLGFDAAGVCDADVDGGVDKRDPKTLTGEAHVTCEELTIPPIDLFPLLSPVNNVAELRLDLLAKEGIITIELVRLLGTAYDVEGKSSIQIAGEPAQSLIDAKFKITVKEGLTLTDHDVGGRFLQSVVDKMDYSEEEVYLTLSGPISDPEVQLVIEMVDGSLKPVYSVAFPLGGNRDSVPRETVITRIPRSSPSTRSDNRPRR